LAALLLAACARTETPPEAKAAPASDAKATAPVQPAPAPNAAGDEATSAASTVPVESAEADPLMAMGEIAGVDCKRAASGLYDCQAPGYQISGDDRACTGELGFGGVLDDTATLLDRFPAEGANRIASLPKGQFLCVNFVAESTSGGEGWAYVTAIAPALVERCAGNATCGKGGLAATWAQSAPAGACGVGPGGRYTVACPAGWVPRAAIEEFSMGL
jgi:hypothetical protein